MLINNPILLTPLVIATIPLVINIYKIKQYKKGAYYKITKNYYSSVMRDKGMHGEYLIYKYLSYFENFGGKFLFNILVPKRNGETAEIDVLLICAKGLFVFECKNYSGWIFGHEAQKNWVQILPTGRKRSHKEYFYNPIMQNAAHIKHLKTLIGQNIPMHSVIVFSDRCTLRDVTIKSSDINVAHHYNIASVITHILYQTKTDITEPEINSIYSKLYPYTQHSYQEREEHIRNINNQQIP